MHSIIKGTLAAAVAQSATVNLSYPAGKTPGNFANAFGHKLILGQGTTLSFPKDFAVTLNAVGTGVTLTNNLATTWPAGTDFILELQEFGENEASPVMTGAGAAVTDAELVVINLGAPATASATAICASQALTAAATNAVFASQVLDVPRNVVAAWTNTAVLTVRGKDQYGVPMTESSASGTSFTGKKAFKTIDRISVSADVTGMTAGSGVLLGLPVCLNGLGYIIKELLDGAVATAATSVAGIVVSGGSTATSGDVRGTLSPNSAPNGARAYTVIALVEKNNLGIPQYYA